MSSAPRIKYEHSPADSLAESFSTPSTQYASLFDTTDTIDPIDIDTIDIMSPAMTPRSYEGDSMFGGSIRGESVLEDTPSTDKKPVKKRKSWGQQLPEPKTNLPPRKRAKTEDEKEQRRVERVLRNRRAAQSSRERKRQEVEALEAEKRDIERRNRDLEMQLAHMQAQNMKLQEELSNFTGSKPVAFAASPVSSSPHQEVHHADTPLTFSKPLFPPRAPENQHALSTQAISDLQAAVQTVNPASLSPEIRPHDFASYFDPSNLAASDLDFLENRVLPVADAFSRQYPDMVADNDNSFDDFNLDDFLHHDDQPASEMHSSDSHAETTASLQPQFGASLDGCDDRGIAVRV
ncbi:hypothetical protein BJ875DRAFT_390110 [Amylocarpus encephaloides]|uniref:BZIP domain-containing protein n=1 Tax=Amylocarpus encephaloides TaxID=45428 RepID=A0A9P7Y7K3_9HELO|nr:hypothetical protein BJ875DRAFT_390110 [Amylocarpus encephaloides]